MMVKELLQDPKKWTKGTFARNSDGNTVDSSDENATCYCLVGAIYKCYGYHAAAPVVEKLEKEAGRLLTFWNDDPNRTHKNVLDLVTKLDI